MKTPVIPKSIQELINSINQTKLNFGEFPVEPHTEIPLRDRFLRVYKPVPDMKNKRTQLYYNQVLKDKETGEEIPNNLPTPEWVIYENFTSSLRKPIIDALKIKVEGFSFDESGRVVVPVKDSETGEIIKDEIHIIEVDSHEFLKWLETKLGMTLTKIISSYVPEFYLHNKELLNKLA